MEKSYLIGVDIGTAGTKAAILIQKGGWSLTLMRSPEFITLSQAG